MSLLIKWSDYNDQTDGTRIYRSEEKFEIDNLPEVLATVPTGVTEYIDHTVERNKVYYYRFGVFKENEEVIGNVIALGNFPYTGPGPKNLLRGDYELGFYGTLSQGEMLSALEIRNQLDLPFAVTTANLTWFKLILNNKIIFIPNIFLNHLNTWQDLYNLGLVYGTDDNGLQPTATPTNQFRTVSKNEHLFIIRLPKASNSETGLVDNANKNNPIYINSEWEKIFYSLSSSNVGSKKLLDINFIFHVQQNWGAMQRPHATQDRLETGQVICRGNHTDITNIYGYSITNNVMNNNTGGYSWFPILELIY